MRISDQEYYRFLPRVTPTSPVPVSANFCQVSVTFELESSVPGEATLEPVGGSLAVAEIGGDHLAPDIDLPDEVYQIDQVVLTTPDGRRLVVDHGRGVLQQAEPNGDALTVNDSGRAIMSSMPSLPLPLRWIGAALSELIAWPTAAALCITAVEDGTLLAVDKRTPTWNLVRANSPGIP